MDLILKKARLNLPHLPGEMGDLEDCNACPGVCGPPLATDSPTGAEVVVIGRNPSPRDIKLRQVLAPGTACGAVVKSMVKVMGLDPEGVYYTNALHCRTPGNRIPSSKEVRVCAAWKSWEMNQLDSARFIIALGVDATKQLLGDIRSLAKIFWDVYEVELHGRPAWVFPCIHPRYVLQNDTLRNPLALWCSEVGSFIERKRSERERAA